MEVTVGVVFGFVYRAVDYGIIHLLCHSRLIEGGNLFWVLLWMSMSYGFANFVWIWLWLDKDEFYNVLDISKLLYKICYNCINIP